MGMPLKSAVPKTANDDAPQKLLDHLHPSSRLKRVPRNAMNRWKFDASMEVQEPPTFTERKKIKHGRKLWQHTDFETMSINEEIPPGVGRFHRCKNKIKTGQGFLDQDTLADLCGAAALQLTFALGNH